VLLAVAAMSTHPAVMGPIFAGALLIRLRWEPRRRRLLIESSKWNGNRCAQRAGFSIAIPQCQVSDSSR